MSKRRVSYTIPAPTDHVPHLKLPTPGASRFGHTGPWLIPAETSPSLHPQNSLRDHGVRQLPTPRHPRHRLGISSLALDTSTQLASGSQSPEGILYSGGRDGMIISWDLHLRMRMKARKKTRAGSQSKYRWELMTGWADDVFDEDGDEDEFVDGDVLGEVTGHKRRATRDDEGEEIPYEHCWEMEGSGVGKPTSFRQCAQMHAEWINDLVLCNYNQTVVSASSDGTLKTWNPHSQYAPDISVFGQHNDYVRCLAVSREHSWIASGSFDRTIKLWDLSRSSSSPTSTTNVPSPLVTLSVPDKDDTKSSVYALAADPFGHVVVSGSPERVVRMWDPRSGKTTGKLVGHTDNIRAILISDDAQYLLTASTDASVKLWSLASPQRCLHTFTHHTDSVWSLYSSHPSLETFYSGDKSGLVCRVDVSGVDDSTQMAVGSMSVSTIDGSGYDVIPSNMDVGHGECILVAAAGEGVDRMVVLDDRLLWTASGTSSEIKRWRVPPTANSGLRGRAKSGSEAEVSRSRSPSRDEDVVLSESPISLNAPLPPIPPPPRSPIFNSNPHHRHIHSHSQSRSPHPRSSTSQVSIQTQNGNVPLESLIRLQFANDAFAVLPSSRSQIGSISREADVATLYSVGGGRAASPHRMSMSSMRAQSPQLVRKISEPVLEVTRELASEAIPYCDGPESVIPGDNGLVRCIILNDRVHVLTVDTAGEIGVWDIVRGICLGVFLRSSYTSQQLNEHWSPRDALETVRERIEGEAFVLPWATADTKCGVLTVHLSEDRCFDAEVYADEVGFRGEKGINDETKLNIGKWALKNLFLGFIREEQRMRRKSGERDRDTSTSSSHSHSHHRHHHHHHSHHYSQHHDRHHHHHHHDRHHRDTSSTNSSSPRSSISSPSRRSTIHPVITSPTVIPALPPPSPVLQQQNHLTSPLTTPLIPLATLANIPQSPGNDATPLPHGRPGLKRLRSGSVMSAEPSESGDPAVAATGAASPTPLPTNKEPSDYFSVSRRPSEVSEENGKEKEKELAVPQTPVPQTPVTPSGLMGRLKSFGKARKPTLGSESGTPATPAVPVSTSGEQPGQGQGQSQTPDASGSSNTAENTNTTAVQALLSSSISPPPSAEVPVHSLPSNITVTISEDFRTLYRGSVNNTGHDVHLLEEAMPLWLMEYLLLNKIPGNGVQPVKVSFILLPWPSKDGEAEQLPELLNTTQSKLTASRWLRVRKLVNHVQDKLEKIASNTNVATPGSPRTSIESQNQNGQHVNKPRAEDVYEILCNDVLLPLDMTLAAVRQYVWRQASELTMYYRLKAR